MVTWDKIKVNVHLRRVFRTTYEVVSYWKLFFLYPKPIRDWSNRRIFVIYLPLVCTPSFWHIWWMNLLNCDIITLYTNSRLITEQKHIIMDSCQFILLVKSTVTLKTFFYFFMIIWLWSRWCLAILYGTVPSRKIPFSAW